MRRPLSYANVVSTLCLFIVLGGGAYAATQLPKNSVGPSQLKKNSVTAAKIKAGAVTGAKIAAGAVGAQQVAPGSLGGAQIQGGSLTGAQIENGSLTGTQIKAGSLTGAQVDSSTLGTVPSARQADALAAAEGWHVVGAPGEPPFVGSWTSEPQAPGSPETVAFYKDQVGVVHLRGTARNGAGPTVFKLPPGFRPAAERTLSFLVYCSSGCDPEPAVEPELLSGLVTIRGTGSGGAEGQVVAPGDGTSFDGITFRAEG